MRPYNAKVVANSPEDMSSRWIGERVSVVDYERVLRNVREARDDVAWGPNNTFVFPARGGTGEIYRRLAAPIADRIRYRAEVVGIEEASRTVQVRGGERYSYDKLVSTMPLDRLVTALRGCPESLRDATANLWHNGVYMVGVGYETPLRDARSWMYFPQPNVPFYRATNFAKYAAANVPGADTARYCSFMTETSYSERQPVARTGLEELVEEGVRAAGLVRGRPKVASVHVEQIEYAYPIPTLGRDRALSLIQPWLIEREIFSRGRFGSWLYEAGNMDHAVKMGIDIARRLVEGAQEELWRLHE
jgi:protoporphyrinogen oxidase